MKRLKTIPCLINLHNFIVNIFLVMELCENGDLNAHLKKLKALEMEKYESNKFNIC